ncbi:hypothetical protein ACTFIB_10710 [Staphylococcus chromogenes]|uniref:hypothetical protein n=1 Tax=Staphylococcus chromogenes TaxID=46126 RepID=UPI003EBC03AA
MLTIGNIYHIIGGDLKDAHNRETNEIDDFETIYKFVKNKKTAYFSPNKETWARELGRNKNALDGNDGSVAKLDTYLSNFATEPE